MPDFMYKGKVYYNPVELAMDQIGGTWKMPILWRLRDKVMRFSELRRAIYHISDKMLTTQLRELEEDGCRILHVQHHFLRWLMIIMDECFHLDSCCCYNQMTC